jgi:hypothetical protein
MPHPSSKRLLCFLSLLMPLSMAMPALAYVDLTPNLSKVIADSKHIALVEVTAFDAEKHRVVLKEVKALKGDLATETVAHEIIAEGGTVIPRPILQWAQPGARGVLFVSGDIALVCYGKGWYQAKSLTTRTWKLGMERPDLPLAYYGTVSRLADAVALMLAGKDAVITTVPHGAQEGASFDLALNRAAVPGAVKVQRIRANMKMPTVAMSVSDNAAYLIGQGPVGAADLPGIVATLKSPDADPGERAEAAGDAGSLNAKGEAAIPALTSLLNDPSPQVKMCAAAALLRITAEHGAALDILTQGLADSQTQVRRAAATALISAGPAAAPLVPELAQLLKDPDAATQLAALQAIDALGTDAAAAAGAVKPLLNDPSLAIDAADALGRIGPAAQPVPPALAAMLSSPQSDVRWAAVRAMSQIGGEAAHPAVDFMIKALPTASELDSYNMHIYLALLGPVAKDAIPAIHAAHLKNPVLPTATIWAIDPEVGFPWQESFRGRMDLTGADGPDFARFIYDAYVHELGPRLRPQAMMLAKEIMAGTAGDIPEWGYKLLNCAAEDSLGTFTPHLADKEPMMRERAAVALGYMGPAARAAQASLKAAITAAPAEREKRLMEWALRRVTSP